MLKNLFVKRTLFFRYKWIYTNSLRQYFDKLPLNADSYQTAYSTIFVRTSIEPELKDLKTTSLSTKNPNFFIINTSKCPRQQK